MYVRATYPNLPTFNSNLIQSDRLQRLRPQSFWYLLTFAMLSLLGMFIYMICTNIHNIVTYENHSVINKDVLKSHVYHTLCHDSLEDDGLPSIKNLSSEVGPKSIFFHETSCRRGLNLRQGCSVEAAARLHPNWQVYVLFNSPVSNKTLRRSVFRTLRKFPNVKLARILSLEYSEDSILYSTVENQLWKSQHPVEHTADLMRIITLNKFGGVHLDLDQIAVKPFDDLPENWIGKETKEDLGSGAMAFTKDGNGKSFIDEVSGEIFFSYNPARLTYNGLEAFQRVLMNRCGEKAITNKTNCTGITIFPPELFYPVIYRWAHLYFQAYDNRGLTGAYTHHLWNMLTKIYNFHEKTPFGRLAKTYCPLIYERLNNVKHERNYKKQVTLKPRKENSVFLNRTKENSSFINGTS